MSKSQILMRGIHFVIIICFCHYLHAQQPFTRVQMLLEQLEFKKAEKLLDSCRKKEYYPDSVMHYTIVTDLRQDNIRQAKNSWKSLKRDFPAYRDVDYLRGLIAFRETNYARSIDDFSKTIRKDSTHKKALYNRAIAYGMMDEYLAAIEDLNRLQKLTADDPQLFYARAYWYEYTGNYREAGKDYAETIRLDPKNFDAYFGLAFVYRNLDEKDKACQTIKKAIDAGSQIAVDLRESYCR